jgi:hypothetical protein
MSNKIKVAIGVIALAVAVGVIVILIVNSQNQSGNTVSNNIVNETNAVNEVNNTVENTAANNTIADDKVKEGERDYSKKTMEEWKEAVKNFYDNNSSVMPDKIEVKDDAKNGKIIINTYDSEDHELDTFEVDKRTWLAIGFEGNTIDFIAGKFVEIESHPKMGFKDDEEIAIAVYKTEEEKKSLIAQYFENEAEFNKYTLYNYGTEQKLVIIPRYDTVFVSLTDTTDNNNNPLVEEVRGKNIIVSLDLTGKSKTFSLVFSHLINNTAVTLQSNPTTGELKLTKENPRVKVLTIEEAKKDTQKDTKKENNL